jgi:hypothetical protein
MLCPNVYPSSKRGLRMEILAGFVVGLLYKLVDPRMRAVVLRQPFLPVVLGLVLGGIQVVHNAC